ncbi:glycosyltransferase family 2 protein [Plectonema radiosum NIES-515]|uniref:Glycosyltransferase family 2 protein n=1 Tax=Plectonema radiosum NIES-515 TaxID=2986073 RepID=A0ABT3B5Q2_9CYAN|nr:glycosyltransferase family 2 protein [Plectonema radiosum]MCV3216717.1 glycosyltransferase family 2 protein [Plectonema radiosum NIES-515]
MIYFLTVNYYSTNLVAQLINSLSWTNTQYKTVIINNSPEDDSIHNLQSESVMIIDAGSNLGFGNACNLGITWIYTQDIQAIAWIINPDAYLPENTLDINRFFKLHPEISILGTIIHTPTGEVWFAGGRFIRTTGSILNQDMLTNTDAEYVACDWVSGCSLIINLANFRECPLFDPAYFLYYEDFEFCRRYANEGYLIAITKQFGVLHQPSSITNRNAFLKTKHSTYSYLFTLEKHTNQLVFILRLIRLICYAILLMFVKPQIGLGKFYGMLNYWQR